MYFYYKKIILWFLIIISFLTFTSVFAQNTRSYSIDSFNSTLTVNKDSTVDVKEEITYGFIGEYHNSYRSISHKDIGAITDIYVTDSNGNRLQYSSKSLDKMDSNSWGKYTYNEENGFTNITWYFNLKDVNQSWNIHYKVHGLIGFYKDYDEVYWNLFTDYDVPIKNISGRIILPFGANYIQGGFYRNTDSKEAHSFLKEDDGSFLFSTNNSSPHEPITWALGFSKGVVLQSAYWNDLMKLNWGFLCGLVMIILMTIFILSYLFFSEYKPKHNKTVVAEYEPPLNLRPAELGLIYREKFSKKTWSATIIDLATKGNLTIIEDKVDKGEVTFLIIMFIFVTFVLIILILPFIFSGNYLPITLVALVIFMFVRAFLTRKKDYTIETKGYSLTDSKLKNYEESFLGALFNGKETFSTKAMKISVTASQSLFLKIKGIEKKLLNEVSKDFPNIYSKSIKLNNKRKKIGGIGFLIILCSFFFLWVDAQIILFTNGIVSVILLYLYFIQFNPKLSLEGDDIWRKIEGFKLYLRTAEKYRMQNLTPELFEKYLPYAIIFGIEKKWAKNFELIIHDNPNWYHSSSLSAGSSISSGQTFSISGFSTSFSSSFSSAFSSSGGGGSGGSSGGGSGGGGGGGGGGGAS
jgi:uncharacterized membrane protein